MHPGYTKETTCQLDGILNSFWWVKGARRRMTGHRIPGVTRVVNHGSLFF